MTAIHPPMSEAGYVRLLAFWLGLLLVLRIGFILASPLNLYADEAQYWRWGQTLAWGYYSKPPAIAWVIEATTELFGTGEWQVRIAAPLLHTLAALLLFATGREIAGARAGFLAALLYALMPAVSLSSFVMSTDGVLMPFWCGALYLLWRLRSGKGGFGSALLLGSAIGFGILSKYAMLYFLAGVLAACITDRRTRHFILSLKGAAAGLATLVLISPHLAWNSANSFATVSHTLDNANLGGDLFNPEHVLSWIADQMAMFGPVSFVALLAGIWMIRRKGGETVNAERWLAGFTLPVLIFILVQSIVSRAHANWTATAYPGAALLLALWFSQARVRILWTAMATNGAIASVLAVLVLLPPSMTTDLGIDNALKRTRGWPDSAEKIFDEARRLGASAILVDEREAWHGLDFYTPDRSIPLLSWRRYGSAKSFAEAQALEEGHPGPILVASLHPGQRPRLRSDFRRFEPAGQVSTDLGKRSNGCPLARTFRLYIAEGYNPQPRTPEWERAFAGQTEFRPAPCPPAEKD